MFQLFNRIFKKFLFLENSIDYNLPELILHLPGFEIRTADSPFYCRWAPAQMEHQETSSMPFCNKNSKYTVFKPVNEEGLKSQLRLCMNY